MSHDPLPSLIDSPFKRTSRGIGDAIRETGSKVWGATTRVATLGVGMSDELQELAKYKPDTGFPDYVKDTYDNALADITKRLWKGALKIAASGFGKGVLVIAAVILGVTALETGFVASTGGMAFAGGAIAGLEKGLLLLGQAPGLVAMAIGGVLGAASDLRRHFNHINAETAEAEAQRYAVLRELQAKARDQQPEQQPAVTEQEPALQPPAPAVLAKNKKEHCGFCARENMRKSQPASMQQGY